MNYSESALQRVREDRLLIDQVDVWLYEEIAPFLGQRVLEVGCGMGNFARHLVDRQLYIGTDISQESVAYVQEEYQRCDNMRAMVADVTSESFRQMFVNNIDTVFSLNVFEHIEDDFGALRNVVSILQPGGTVVLIVPAHQRLYGTIDRAIGHYRRYDKDRMSKLFESAGLKCVTQKYINLLGALGWFTSARVFKHDVPPSGQLRTFNRLVPTLKSIERRVTVPFGISLLAVGTRH
jgi:SAM-dependent methyltransferase